MSQIKCKNLSIGYDKKIILENLNFEVEKSDYLCIVGSNGAGKSTLMKTILNLIPPISGKIEYGDGLKPNEIGYLPQQTLVQKDFPCHCIEIVLSGFEGQKGFRPFYSKKEKFEAIENMEKMGIKSFAKRCYNELSGGQQQRVLLARALCSTKKLIVLDEPVAGLDPVVTKEMYELIKNINRNEKITIIMITHDMNEGLNYATHVLHVGPNVTFMKKEDFKNSI